MDFEQKDFNQKLMDGLAGLRVDDTDWPNLKLEAGKNKAAARPLEIVSSPLYYDLIRTRRGASPDLKPVL